MMKEAIEEGNKKLKLELHKDMKELKNDIVKEAHIYADEINEKLKKQMMDIQSTLSLALTVCNKLHEWVNQASCSKTNQMWSDHKSPRYQKIFT